MPVTGMTEIGYGLKIQYFAIYGSNIKELKLIDITDKTWIYDYSRANNFIMMKYRADYNYEKLEGPLYSRKRDRQS